jgi:hypothetical protein
MWRLFWTSYYTMKWRLMMLKEQSRDLWTLATIYLCVVIAMLTLSWRWLHYAN